MVPGETELVFTISKGREPRTLDNLVGYNEKELTNYEQTSGFDIDISYETSETVPKGEVISQSPAKGSKLVRGAQVKVVVSKGPAEKPVENVTLSVTIPYEPPVSDAIDEELDEDGNLREPEPERRRKRSLSRNISRFISKTVPISCK